MAGQGGGEEKIDRLKIERTKAPYSKMSSILIFKGILFDF